MRVEDDPRPQPDAPWLSEEEMSAWLNLSEIALTLPAELSSRLQQEAGISFYEYMVMAMLSEQPDLTLQLSELAELTSGSLSRLSHVLTRLEGEGYVRRVRSQSDRRARLATLTEAGLARVVALAPVHVAHVRQLVFAALSPAHVRQLAEATDLIVARVRPEGRVARPGRGRRIAD